MLTSTKIVETSQILSTLEQPWLQKQIATWLAPEIQTPSAAGVLAFLTTHGLVLLSTPGTDLPETQLEPMNS